MRPPYSFLFKFSFLFTRNIYPFFIAELRCPNDCSSQGGCNTATGICVCNVGFLGDACQFLDDKVLLECNTAGDCPSIRTQCHAMANPTPSGKTGYCVPSTCENQSDCSAEGLYFRDDSRPEMRSVVVD